MMVAKKLFKLYFIVKYIRMVILKENFQTGKLLLLLSILLVAGFSVTSWISYSVSRQSIRNQIINNELPLTSDNIYSEIQRDLLPPVFIASLMANDSFLRNWVIRGEKDIGQITQFLAETQGKYHTFTSFFVSEKTRKYYYSKGILKTVTDDNKQDSWYFRVRKMAQDHEINVDPDQANQFAMTIFVNHRVFDFDGNYIGATGVGLQASVVKKLIESYHRKFNRTIYFVSPEGNIILSSVDSSTRNIKNLPGLRDIASEILTNKTISCQYDAEGNTFYVNTRFIPELNWILVVEKSDESLVKNIFHTLMLNLLLCGIVTIIVIILINLIVNSYRRRLNQMLSTEHALKNQNSEQEQEIRKQHQELLDQNSKLRQLNVSKDKLFSIIAHDLRAPLGHITHLSLMVDNNLKENDQEKALSLLTKIKELSAATLHLLDHLFDWAKSQMSELICNPTNFNLRNFLLECLIEAEINAEKKNISVSLNCDTELSACADLNMTMTIIRNLISNAVKFTMPGGKIEISAADISPDFTEISIKDTGVGIEPNRICQLFDFIQNKSTFGTEGEKGTGLGLSLCRELVHKNGGEITVESQPDSGSTFRFTLPKSLQG